jgi:hypothetical protein
MQRVSPFYDTRARGVRICCRQRLLDVRKVVNVVECSISLRCDVVFARLLRLL